ncbi:carboxypeptidase M32 [Priestia filamentosa]|uniref:carboxypeptidase M32 n=1 Tax=Priestia filamentosa TaxID=1402861 RepID=UPI0002FA7B11|nr:carboxypeptidase M32 [Priestia filamentosa]
MDINKRKEEFHAYVEKMGGYKEAVNVMYWDMRTGAPKKGVKQRSNVLAMLSSDIFSMSISNEMAGYIKDLGDEEVKKELDAITLKMVEECKKDYEQNQKIPEQEYREYVMLTSEAGSIWEEAKEKSDFSLFEPYLEQIVAFNQKFAEYWGYEGHKYNALLDTYEPGVTVETLDRVFGDLKETLLTLLQKVQKAESPKTDFLYEAFPKEKQEAFSLEILKELDYDFEAGRLDETVHPFAIGLNPGDVRITTKYDESDFRVAIFGTIHECGHAVYEQNISKELVGTNLCTGTSMGIHESQSLFYELMIGRTKAFWERHYEALKEHGGSQFQKVDLDEFYQAVNEVKPSLIRIEADELTYVLHIIIRYEIEKALINGEIEVKDLPTIWNDKYEEYLGVRPAHDGEGVLQDVHWSDGSFGYFPSYALGYIYAAQLKNALVKDLPDFEERIQQGKMTEIRAWLTKHIHQYGKLKDPLELLKAATGEGLEARYLVEHLTEKYSKLYNL